MPGREEPLITDSFYHVFNKTIESKNIFTNPAHCELVLDLFRYYRSLKSFRSYSLYKSLSPQLRKIIDKTTNDQKFYRIEIYSHILMPTHFHILLRQKAANGISQFISNVINSFTRYFNLRYKRKGPIFLTKFKARRVMNREEFIHTSRYIHLNCYSSGLITNIEEIVNYPWSSLKEYFHPTGNSLVNTSYLMVLFNNNMENFKKFIFNQADYQKNLEQIKIRDK